MDSGNDNDAYVAIYTEMESYERMGVTLLMDQRRSSPMQVADNHAAYGSENYMRDYILEDGYLKEIHFDMLPRNRDD